MWRTEREADDLTSPATTRSGRGLAQALVSGRRIWHVFAAMTQTARRALTSERARSTRGRHACPLLASALVFGVACSAESPDDSAGSASATITPGPTDTGQAPPATSNDPGTGSPSATGVPTDAPAGSSPSSSSPGAMTGVPTATMTATADPGPSSPTASNTASSPTTTSDSGNAGGVPNPEPTNAGGMPSDAGGGMPNAAGSGGMGGMDGMDSDGPGSALLFESDFEADTVGEMPDTSVWTNSLPTEYDSMGIVRVDSSKAHSGSNSIYVKKGNDGQAFLQMDAAGIFPVSSGPIHVRAWLLTPEWPSNHVSWMEVGAVKNEENEIRVGAHLGVLQVNQYPPDSDKRADGVTFAANEWHCIEYAYDAADGSFHVWLDDAPVDDLTVVAGDFNGTVLTPWPPIAAVRFGAEINTTEAWFDDIAISNAPIGCN